MKKTFLIAVAAGSLLVLGCNRNPGWDGHESTEKADKLAEQACKCIYEVMDQETAFDVGEILDNMEDFQKYQRTGGEGSISEKWPDIAKAMEMVVELSEKIDGSPCMEEVDDLAMRQGVSIERLFEAIDAHCSLSVFYN